MADTGPDFGPAAGGVGLQTDGLPRAQGRWDKLTIVNDCLISTANNTVTTADDGSDEWRVASNAFDRYVEELLYRGEWSFATLIYPQLERIGSSSEPGYGDVFAKPQNCLFLQNVWRADLAALVMPAILGAPSSQFDRAPPPLDYIVIGDQIHTTAELGACARYIPYPDGTSMAWSVGFVAALKLFIEAACYDGLNEDGAMSARRLQRAELAFKDAKALSDKEMPRRVVMRSPMMESRKRGARYFR